MQARQEADFSEGGFAKLVPFFFFFLFKYFFLFLFLVPPSGSQGWFDIPMVVVVGGGGKQWDLPQG